MTNELGGYPKGKIIVQGGDIYTPTRIIRNGMIGIEGNRIVRVGPVEPVARGAEVVDATGKIVAPGFVDIHVHGGGGGDFIDATPGAVTKALDYHAAHGTTSIVPSTTTAPMEDIFAAFDNIRSMMGKEGSGAQILGIHMEGPYFAKPEPGCHIVELIHNPVPEETERLMGYRDILKRVTVAPEIEGALDFIRRCAAEGILCSGGHSNAVYEEVRKGVEAGMSHLTHHWSAMSATRRVNARRFAGMVEAGLVSDDLTTEVIADGRHLPTSLLRLAFKCKGAERLCLISDAMRGAGMPEGVYEICGLPARVRDGVAWTMDGLRLASSIIPVEKAVQHMILEVGLAPLEVLRMASLTPAEVIGAAGRKGSLAPGKDADILLIDPARFTVEKVILGGRIKDLKNK